MIDRIFYGEQIFKGEVIDMFDFYGIWNAIFNVADSFVCIGAAVTICTLLYDIIIESKKKKAEQKTAKVTESTTTEEESQNEEGTK